MRAAFQFQHRTLVIHLALFFFCLSSKSTFAQSLKVGCLSSNEPLAQILTKMFAEEHFPAEVLVLPAERSHVEFHRKAIDAEFLRTASTTQENQDAILIDVPLLVSEYRAYTRDSTIQIHKISDLAPYSIGYPLGTRVIEKLLTGYRTVPIYHNKNLADMLAMKRIDVFITNQFVAEYLTNRFPYLTLIPQNPPLIAEPVYFVLHKSKAQYKDRITAIFNKWVKSGRWDREVKTILQ